MVVLQWFSLFLLLTISDTLGYLDKLSQLGEACSYDRDCDVDYAYCRGQRECSCMTGFSPDETGRKCIASIGASCLVDRDCSSTLPFSLCYQGVCDCDDEHVPHSNKKECLQKASLYRDTCTEPIQCIESFGDGGQCLFDKCVCLPKYHFVKGNCLINKGLGEPCNSTDQCFVSDEQTPRIKCDPGVSQCTCLEGFTWRNNECSDGGSQVLISLLSLIFSFILTKIII